MLRNFHCCLWTQQDGRGQKQVWSSAAILVFVLTTSNCTLVTKIDPDTTTTHTARHWLQHSNKLFPLFKTMTCLIL